MLGLGESGAFRTVRDFCKCDCFRSEQLSKFSPAQSCTTRRARWTAITVNCRLYFHLFFTLRDFT